MKEELRKDKICEILSQSNFNCEFKGNNISYYLEGLGIIKSFDISCLKPLKYPIEISRLLITYYYKTYENDIKSLEKRKKRLEKINKVLNK